MIDASGILRFKQTSNEDFIIAGLIANLISTNKLENILDIGAGTGAISEALATLSENDCLITAIEPLSYFFGLYGDNVSVIQNRWENVEINKKFDLIIFSHVIVEFEEEERENLILKAKKNLTQNGKIIVVTNGENPRFDFFVQTIFKTQGYKYQLDHKKFIDVICSNNLLLKKQEKITFLKLGINQFEVLKNINIFFPEDITLSEQHFIDSNLEKLKIGDSYSLPVNQCIYLIENK